MGARFRIDASTLDPRPDTETLIEAALGFEDREAPLRHPRPRHGERLHPRDAVGGAAAGKRRRRRCQPCGRLSWRGPMRQFLVSGTVRPSSPLTGSRPSRQFRSGGRQPAVSVGGRYGRALPRGARITIRRPRSTAALTGFPPIAASCGASAKCFVLAGFALFEIGHYPGPGGRPPPCRGGPYP